MKTVLIIETVLTTVTVPTMETLLTMVTVPTMEKQCCMEKENTTNILNEVVYICIF